MAGPRRECEPAPEGLLTAHDVSAGVQHALYAAQERIHLSGRPLGRGTGSADMHGACQLPGCPLKKTQRQHQYAWAKLAALGRCCREAQR